MHKPIRFPILLLVVSGIGSVASAGYVTKFENPPFVPGPINGQDGWGTGNTGAVITTAAGNPGQGFRDTSTAFTQVTRANVFDSAAAFSNQTVVFDMRNLTDITDVDTAANAIILHQIVLFGSDDNGATADNNQISFNYDARTNGSSVPTNNRFTIGALNSPDTVGLGTWYNVEIKFDYAADTADALVTFSGTGAVFWDPAPVSLISNGNKNFIQPTAAYQNVTGSTFDLDNLGFFIPEPASAAVVGVGAVFLTLRSRRRANVH